MFVGLAMAGAIHFLTFHDILPHPPLSRIVSLEVCSSIPTSGGPYFWAAKLADSRTAAFAAWVRNAALIV